MIILDSALKSLEVKLAGAVTTTELPYVSSYVDVSQTTFGVTSIGEKDGTSNGGTAVTVVSAPAATTSRKVNYLSVVNVDTVAATITVQVNNNGTARIVARVVLQVGDCLEFTDARGFYVLDSTGHLKDTSIGAGTVTNAMLAGSIAASKLIGTDIATLGTITTGVWNAGAITSTGAFQVGTGTQLWKTVHGSDTYLNGYNGTQKFLRHSSGYNIVFSGGSELQFLNAAETTLIAALSDAGLLTVNGLGTHTFAASGTGQNILAIRQSTDGGTNYGGIEIGNNAGIVGFLYVIPTTTSLGAPYAADGLFIGAQGAGGLGIGAFHASGAIRFYSGGTTLRAQINTTGTQTWAPYGAGAATFDASGNITSVSDARFKDRIAPLPYGLEEVLQLRPVQHGYNALSELERDHLYGGFIAQEVNEIMPLAVGQDQRGYLTLADRPVLGAVVHAIQTLTARLSRLEGA